MGGVMREIKFRAWFKSEKKMYGVSELQLAFGSAVCCNLGTHERPYFYVDSEDIELMQYVGQADKNGVEIYEGDIVKRTYNNGEYVEIAIVEYDDLSFEFRFQGFDYDLDIHCGRLEVIGNIYENPELLEVA